MSKELTKKQSDKIRTEAKHAALDAKVGLEFSIKLLEDYISDLKLEMVNLKGTIRKSKLKLKKIKEKLEQ